MDTRPRTTASTEESRRQAHRETPLPPAEGGGVSLYIIVSCSFRCLAQAKDKGSFGSQDSAQPFYREGLVCSPFSVTVALSAASFQSAW